MGVSKIRDTFLWVPMMRTIVFGGLYWGSAYFGKLPHADPACQEMVEALTTAYSPQDKDDLGSSARVLKNSCKLQHMGGCSKGPCKEGAIGNTLR